MTPAPLAGPSKESHDYTEDASPIDIKNALANSRRSTEFSVYNDDEGAMFSGPGHSANPSSVTRMSNLDPARRSWSRSRRKSHDSGVSGRPSFHTRMSQDSEQNQVSRQSSEGESLDGESSRTSRGRHRQNSPTPARTSVLGNLANFFGKAQTDREGHGRRLSISSRRSSASLSRRSARSDAGSDYAVETDDEERWGYSSGEEDSNEELSERDDVSVNGSMAYDSEPPSPSMGQGLPLLSSDRVFGGDSRIEMDFSFAEMGPPPPGPPSRQKIYIEDDDSTIRLVGYEITQWRHWFPRLWLRSVTHEKAFMEIKKGFVVVEISNRDIVLIPLQKLEYSFSISTVFSPTVPLDQSYSSPSGESGQAYDAETKMLHSLLMVNYRYSRFALDPRNGQFSTMRTWRDSTWTSASSLQSGLQQDVRQQRTKLFDRNEINVEAKSTLALLIDEVIHPFYVFQVASIILCFCIFAISMGSIATTLIETKKTISRMREMSKFSCNVSVMVDGAWFEMDSAELVPGDVVNLSSSHLSVIPADMYLLAGDAILNESMLTGESLPVSKIPVKDDDLIKWKDGKSENPKSFIYGGTKVVRIRASMTNDGTQDRPALAVVARTGFDTTKGALVRSMLFPKPIGFKFYRDSMRFIAVLTGIALLGFSTSVVQFIRIGLKWQTILIRALDLITVVVPPALPATLSIGTSFAIGRLKKFGIHCISPSRINVAGKINVCCFDKTGTLTEDGLDILGIRPSDRNANRAGELLDDIHDLPTGKDKASFLHALATCHSLKMVEGETVGDPLDVKMFEFTKWTLEEGTVGRLGVIKARSGAVAEQAALVQTVVRPPGSAQFRLEDALKGNAKRAHFLELGVIRTFEFVSSLRRMSVVVKRLKSSSMEIYVKGAPEIMVDICEKDSFPDDYDDLLSYYTKRGYRVIAMAGKSIEGLSWLKAQRMKREQAESKLRFLGLIIFENKIKPGTSPAIQALRSAHLACRMITGDNPLTAVSVARECGLINQAAHVFSPSFVRGDATLPEARLEWASMDEPLWKLDSYSLKPLSPPLHHTVDVDEIGYHDYSLVVSGDVFRWMMSHAPLETLQRMLVKAQVFARMSPDEKNEVVERLQGLGYTVLMCGDGANDCAALKAADVGISLSEAEASVAAPFTSSTPDIGCVLELIKEGRCALVTSFGAFKFMALYSLIQFTTVTLLYSFASSLGDFQFLYIDLFIIIPIAVTMGRSLPYPGIFPKRPSSSLVSKKVLSSIVGQILLTGAAQFWAYTWVRGQEWYTPPPSPDPKDDGNQLESTNFENSVLFLISCFQYILAACVFSIGPPYRKPMWTNVLLMLSLIILTSFNLLVLLSPPQAVVDLLTLMIVPKDGRLKLLMAAAVNVIVCIIYEEYGVPVVSEVVGQMMKWRKKARRVRENEGKVYTAVEGGLRL
ncbi:hypothetical protein D9757_000675 [Collybiopsis confluens]|uniref:Cation-transporting ATPase n=1 Tax=Collybiopsis confluens TaxID=2823264 RepID=A0A8H5I1Q1_9AGAR|nr:hypothetical protein D9757_000675 [Collybiopsis confluens]